MVGSILRRGRVVVVVLATSSAAMVATSPAGHAARVAPRAAAAAPAPSAPVPQGDDRKLSTAALKHHSARPVHLAKPGASPHVSSPLGPWTSRGPQPIAAERCCGFLPDDTILGATAGRTTALAVVPGSGGSTAYLGSAGGGVWKTTDSGTSWQPVTQNQASLAIGAVAVNSTGQTVYAATGEENYSGDSQYGQGVLKSTDGGGTWTLLGQSTLVGLHIGGLAIDQNPTTSGQHVFAATDRGLYQSTDGGTSWTLNTSLAALGSNYVTPPSHGVFDIVQDPTSVNDFYVSIGDICGTERGAIAKSVDGGATWSLVRNYDAVAGDPAPAGRIALGIGTGVLYAAVSDCGGSLAGIDKTTDGGATWTRTTPTGFNPSGHNLFDYLTTNAFFEADEEGETDSGGQGWYDNSVSVDPSNPAHVLFGGVTLLATSDGGTTFTDVGDVYGERGFPGSIHPDYHAAVFFAPDSAYVGNDGGVYKTTNLGGTGTSADWTSLNATLNTTQFYAGDALDANHYLGGAQDNGTIGILPAATATPPAWQMYHGGDGGYVGLIPGSQTIYAEYPDGAIERGSSGTNPGDPHWPYDSFSGAAPCSGCSPQAFATPFRLDPLNTSRLVTATTRVYESRNDGRNWAVISPTFQQVSSDYITAVTLVPGTGTIIVGNRYGLVHVTTNDGLTWTDITGNLPTLTASNYARHPDAADIAYNPADPAELWVATGTTDGSVWHTTNAGASSGTVWTNLSGTAGGALLPGPVLSLFVDPAQPSSVYAGSAYGVELCTTCGGAAAAASWTRTSLPAVEVDQLTRSQDGTTLFAWTHGLGAWSMSLGSAPLSIRNTSLPYGEIGHPYIATLAAQGGTSPYQWSISAGSLPPGLVLDATSGLLHGTPTATGTFSVTVQVSDAAGTPHTITQAFSITVSPLIVSQFRFPGPSGSSDGYVEIANISAASVALRGWSLQIQGAATVPLPDRTLPPGNHVLVAASGYSLGAVAAPDATLAGSFPTAGVRIVAPDGSAVDGTGYYWAGADYRTGNGVAVITTATAQYAYVRKIQAGRPVDTGSNLNDFTLVSVDPANPAGATLGSPDPHDLASPVQRNDIARSSLFDRSVSASRPPNRVYDSAAHTLTVRRVITNASATETITALQVRMTSLSTTGVPGTHAILRWLDSSTQTVNGRTVLGVTIAAPAHPDGGGVGSAATVPLPGGSLAPHASVNVAFVFAVDTGGSYSFGYDSEALTS